MNMYRDAWDLDMNEGNVVYFSFPLEAYDLLNTVMPAKWPGSGVAVLMGWPIFYAVHGANPWDVCRLLDEEHPQMKYVAATSCYMIAIGAGDGRDWSPGETPRHGAAT